MKLRLALAAATCLVLPIAAHAQPVTGPYVSLGAGTTIQAPVESCNFVTPTPAMSRWVTVLETVSALS